MKQKLVFWGFVLYIPIAFFISLFFFENYLSILIVFNLPLIYIYLKQKELVQKSFKSSALISIPPTLIITYFAYKDGVWALPHWTNIKILDSVYLDDFIWQILYAVFIIAFYEFFFDSDRKKNIYPKGFTRYIFYGLSSVLLFIFLIEFTALSSLVIPYFAIIFSVLFFIIFPTLLLSRYPKMFEDIAKASIFFLFYSIAFEYAALAKGAWSFPGENFVGWVHLGAVSFTFEELLWLVFAAPAVLCYYEYFCDDRK